MTMQYPSVTALKLLIATITHVFSFEIIMGAVFHMDVLEHLQILLLIYSQPACDLTSGAAYRSSDIGEQKPLWF